MYACRSLCAYIHLHVHFVGKLIKAYNWVLKKYN